MCLIINKIISREFRLARRQILDWLLPLGFMFMVVILFPLVLMVTPNTLQQIAPAVIWVAIVLSQLLVMGHWLRDDLHDGSLVQDMLLPLSLSIVLGLRLAVMWLILVVPALLITPILGYMMYLAWSEVTVLLLSILLATPVMLLLAAFAACLTVGLRQSGMLVTLLVLPLQIPVLIFAVSAVVSRQMGMPVAAPLLMLVACDVLAVVLLPLLAAKALRIGMS